MAKKKNDVCCDNQHPDHSKQLSRLNRVGGQVDGIKKMIAERRYCPDILTQLRAVRSAIHAVEASILETHLDACISDALHAPGTKDAARKITELKDIYRRFGI